MLFVCDDPKYIKNVQMDMYLNCVNKLMHGCAVNLGTDDSLWFCSFHKQQQSISIYERCLNKEKCRQQEGCF